VFSTRKGHPAPRVLTKHGQKTPFFEIIGQTTKASTWSCGETERSILQGLASPWDTIPVNAQDTTKQRCAKMTQREDERRHSNTHAAGTRTQLQYAGRTGVRQTLPKQIFKILNFKFFFLFSKKKFENLFSKQIFKFFSFNF